MVVNELQPVSLKELTGFFFVYRIHSIDSTKEQVMKKSEILKKTLEDYDLNMDDHLGYVCHAVQHAVNGRQWPWASKSKELQELLDEIQTSLCGKITVMNWLCSHHSDWYIDNIWTDKVTPSEYRKSWMQQMIDMYESKGE